MSVGAEAQARRRRTVGVVIIAALVLWVAAQWLGTQLGVPVSIMLVLDLAALAAFGWAIWASFRLWRDGSGQGRQ